MKRLFYYIPELMLAAGVLLAAGILLTCKCPRLAAPIIGPDVYLPQMEPEPECINDKIPAGAKSCWKANWGSEIPQKCPDGTASMWAMTNRVAMESCVPLPSPRPDAELYGKWMQVRPSLPQGKDHIIVNGRNCLGEYPCQ